MEKIRIKLWLWLKTTMFNATVGLVTLAVHLTANANEVIDLNWALKQSLNSNPVLQAYPYDIRISESNRVQVDQAPLPKLTLELENAAGGGDFNGLSQSDTTVSIGQLLERGNKQQFRQNVAKARTEQLHAEYTIDRLDVLTETARRYYEVLRLQEMTTYYEFYSKQQQQSVNKVQQLARAGSVGQADVSKLQLELAKTQAAQLQLHNKLQLAKHRLTTMWLSSTKFEHATGNLLNTPLIPSHSDISIAIENTPDYLVQQSRLSRAEQQLRLAKANGVTDIDVGIGVRHFAETDDQALVFNIAMPLAYRNPNRGNIAAAQARFERNQQQQDWTRQHLTLTMEDIQQRLSAIQIHTKTIRQQLLPQAQQLVDNTERGYRIGQYSILQWLDAQKTQFQLQRELITSYSQLHLGLLELQRLTGQSFISTKGTE